MFLDPSPRVMETKVKIIKCDLIKLISFCTAMETINKMKRQPTEWEKIFANGVTNRGILKIYQQPALSLLFSPWVVSLLWPHGRQHARLPCPSLSPEVCSNSCPLSQWCYLSLPLLPPSLFAFNLSQHQDLFQWVGSSHQVAKVLELQLQDLCFFFVACLFICFVPFSFGFPIFPLLMSSNSMHILSISPLLVYRL